VYGDGCGSSSSCGNGGGTRAVGSGCGTVVGSAAARGDEDECDDTAGDDVLGVRRRVVPECVRCDN